MLKKVLKQAAYGFVLGVAVGNIIAFVTGHPNIVSSLLLERTGSLQAALLAQSLCSGLIGAVSWAAKELYNIENWPLLLSCAIHYLAYSAVFIPSAIYLGWTEDGRELALLMTIMAAVHLSIFVVMCIRYRASVRELNDMQQNLRAKQTTPSQELT